jgi:hypothetical protein
VSGFTEKLAQADRGRERLQSCQKRTIAPVQLRRQGLPSQDRELMP